MKGDLNCWQYKNCGREKGGLMVESLGECPVSTTMKYDGLNGGQGAGRACWMVPHSASHSDHDPGNGRWNACHNCEFYKRVVFENKEKTRFRYVSAPD